jgi:putative tricarboxylic transport membrane protein
MSKDRYLSISLILVTLFMFIETFNIAEKSSWQMYGSAFYPRILLALLAVLSVTLLIKSFTNKADLPKGAFNLTMLWKKYDKIILLFVFFGLYAASLPYLGFIIASLLYLFISQGLLLGYKEPKTIMLNTTVSVVTTFSVYFIFNNFLNVWLP